MPGGRRFLHYADRDEMTRAMASTISGVLDESIEKRGFASLVLAGGSTPRPVYERLARDRSQWWAVSVFWGDERCVPPHDPRSNYALAKEALLDHVEIPPGNVHRIAGELAPDEAARRYEAVLRETLGPGEQGFPVFDCVLLGLGADGHTASLFAGDLALEETRRWATTTDGANATPPVPRVTLTLPVLNAARHVLFAVAGREKLGVVRAIEASEDDHRYPAARVQPAGGTDWYVCDVAGSNLSPDPRDR